MGASVIRDEGGIAQSLWKKSTNESIFAIYTPYILSLASGKLDSGSFLHCIFQDLRFLQASAEAFEMAEECSDDDDDKTVIRKIRKRVLKKMTMFRSIVQVGSQIPITQKDVYAVVLICI
ncbi:hypothetical protein R6Q57_017544 [Mikania cordata]